MIVRAWNGYASATNADAYPKHLLETIRPKLKRVAGFRGFYLLRRAGREEVQYQVLTLWDTMQAVRVCRRRTEPGGRGARSPSGAGTVRPFRLAF
jgi:heme-degrading monooxygenase HmoA